jgi:hypothetical protein
LTSAPFLIFASSAFAAGWYKDREAAQKKAIARALMRMRLQEKSDPGI